MRYSLSALIQRCLSYRARGAADLTHKPFDRGFEPLEPRVLLSGDVAMPADGDAGDDMDCPQDVIISPEPIVIEQTLSRTDRLDFYRFVVSVPVDFRLTLEDLEAPVDVFLLDADGRKIAASKNPGKQDESISKSLDPGEYFVKVRDVKPRDTPYTLTLAAPPTAGSTLETARGLGVLQDTRLILDSLSRGDRKDLYRFAVVETETISLALGGLSQNADLSLLNEEGRRIAKSWTGGTNPEMIQKELDPGIYYAEVRLPKTRATEYALTLVGPDTDDPVPDEPGNTTDTAANLGLIDGTDELVRPVPPPPPPFIPITDGAGDDFTTINELTPNTNPSILGGRGLIVGSSRMVADDFDDEPIFGPIPISGSGVIVSTNTTSATSGSTVGILIRF